jgi:hypothetical protein
MPLAAQHDVSTDHSFRWLESRKGLYDLTSPIEGVSDMRLMRMKYENRM